MQRNKVLITYSHFCSVFYRFRSEKLWWIKIWQRNWNRASSSFLSLGRSLSFYYFFFLSFSPPLSISTQQITLLSKNTYLIMKDRADVSPMSCAQQRWLSRHGLRSKRGRANFRAITRLETLATQAKTDKPFGLHFFSRPLWNNWPLLLKPHWEY